MADSADRPKPSKKQIAAVRAVLYERKRLRQLLADLHSIDVLMGLHSADGAPVWVVSATGKPGSSLLEAVSRCRRVATAHRAMSSELGALSLPAADKQDLRSGLNEQATVWEVRARLWAATVKPDVTAALAQLKSHQAAAFRAAQKVSAYLRHGDDFQELGR